MRNEVLKNYFFLLLSQLSILGMNILMSLIFPKLLTIEDFGYWQLFLFYSSYVGFFHFGINDGIYLRYGGKNLETINKDILNSQVLLIFFTQIFFLIIGIYFFTTIRKIDKFFVSISVLLLMVISNLMGFYNSIFQATNKLKFFSNSTIIISLSYLCFIVFLFFTNNLYLNNIIVAYVCSNFLSLLYLIYIYQKEISNKFVFSFSKKYLLEYKKNLYVGFLLMISTICSMLIIGVGRFYIEKKWGIKVFSIVSLAFTFTTFVLFFIRQIGIVIFPILKRTSSDLRKKYFLLSTNLINMMLLSSFLTIPLINYFIINFIPKYEDSLKYVVLLFPTIIYEGKMQIILNTYMKVLRKEKVLMIVNIISLIVSIILCTIFSWFNNLDMIVISITFSVILRGIILEYYLNKKLETSNFSNLFFVCILSISIIILKNIFELNVVLIIYSILYILYLVIYRRVFFEIKQEFKFLNKSNAGIN